MGFRTEEVIEAPSVSEWGGRVYMCVKYLGVTTSHKVNKNKDRENHKHRGYNHFIYSI